MKQFAFFLSMILLALNTFAGDNEKSGIGFKGGLVLSTVGNSEEDASTQKGRMKLGGFGGLNYERQFGDVVAFEVEVLYANLGVNIKQDLPLGYKFSNKRNFHAMQLPINLKFYIGDNFNVYVGGYGQYMFAIRDHKVTKDPDGDVTAEERSGNLLKSDVFNPEDSDGTKLIMPWDAGVQGGVEFISDMGLGVGARFQKGLIDITNKKFAIDDDKWVTNTGIQIYLVGHF